MYISTNPSNLPELPALSLYLPMTSNHSTIPFSATSGMNSDTSCPPTNSNLLEKLLFPSLLQIELLAIKKLLSPGSKSNIHASPISFSISFSISVSSLLPLVRIVTKLNYLSNTSFHILPLQTCSILTLSLLTSLMLSQTIKKLSRSPLIISVRPISSPPFKSFLPVRVDNPECRCKAR